MIDAILLYVSESPGRIIAVSIAVILAIVAWHKLYRSNDPLVLRLLAIPVSFLPIFGPLMIFWIFSMPEKQPRHLRQNRWNHYGSRRFGENDIASEDVYEDFQKTKKKKKSRLTQRQRPLSKKQILVGVGIGLLAIQLILFGMMSIAIGSWQYRNWWGGSVFAPAAIIIGTLLMLILMKKWKKSSSDKQ